VIAVWALRIREHPKTNPCRVVDRGTGRDRGTMWIRTITARAVRSGQMLLFAVVGTSCRKKDANHNGEEREVE
jgi:hypothetical protein